ncbi:unnamed protein product [Phyllotreta striolata]|uniref:Uncharacterized protein n=1 Tax=Phyllotreta striolata TaxID=444603 RepID=A0A9N9TDL7_PHYSR|nr:unnamed protein product [Phyllotreta striolata]
MTVEQKTENGLVQFKIRIPPILRTLTEKPGLLDLRNSKQSTEVGSVVRNNIIRTKLEPVVIKAKTIKISKAPPDPPLKTPIRDRPIKRAVPLENLDEEIRKPIEQPKKIDTYVKKPPKEKKKIVRKQSNRKISQHSFLKKRSTLSKKPKKKRSVGKIVSNPNIPMSKTTNCLIKTNRVEKQWMCCTVNNRLCKSEIEMPTYESKGVGTCTDRHCSNTAKFFKNYHQEKLARLNEQIRNTNAASSIFKPKQKELTPTVRSARQDKLEKLNEEIREMNSKRSPTTKYIPAPIEFREKLRKKLNQLNTEIRLTNKNRIDATRRLMFIRQLKKRAMKKKLTLNRQQKEMEEGTKRNQNKFSLPETIRTNKIHKKRHRSSNMKKFRNYK